MILILCIECKGFWIHIWNNLNLHTFLILCQFLSKLWYVVSETILQYICQKLFLSMSRSCKAYIFAFSLTYITFSIYISPHIKKRKEKPLAFSQLYSYKCITAEEMENFFNAFLRPHHNWPFGDGLKIRNNVFQTI